MERAAGKFSERDRHPIGVRICPAAEKLLPQAFEDLFHRFTDTLTARKKFQGCRLLAVDGTSLKSMSYPEDSDAYRSGTQRQHGWNLYHINALFDLENGIYTDVLVQKHQKRERDFV